jgi:hypothetical protein
MTGKITGNDVLWVSCVGLLMGAAALAWAPAVSGEGFSPATIAQQDQPAKIDRSLPGMKKGIVSKAHDRAVWIDGSRYVLGPGALVEDKFGTPLTTAVYQASGVEWEVQYWLAPDQTHQINQMIISFPE